ncbi:MAG TPA: hypothetical protein VGF86_00290 [Candidatus Tumulicola sp.]|jgi:hypothetical protein
MSFNAIGGRFFLAAGESTGFIYWFGLDGGNNTGAEDRGSQWAMAHPELNTGSYPEQGVAELAVSNFRKRGYYSGDTGDFYYGYSLQIENTGIDTWYSVQGGGNT